jgi:hypothetical protein
VLITLGAPVIARLSRRDVPPRDRDATASTDMTAAHTSKRSLLLQRVQPAMTGLIDGSLPTLAPICAVALATHRPR